MPQRIQRKRGKGWKMPEGVVYVGWPTKWGNNFRVGIDGTASECIEKYRARIRGNMWSFPTTKDIQAELRGKDLACWCRVGDPCHADVLLEIANT